jgi:hypothetical protein
MNSGSIALGGMFNACWEMPSRHLLQKFLLVKFIVNFSTVDRALERQSF